MKAADLKGVPYKKVVVLPPMHKLQMRLGFGGNTVPAMKFEDSEKVQSSRAIMRALESMKPEPALFPSDPDRLDRVLDAETWGNGNFQDIGRRLVWSHLMRAPEDMTSFTVGEKVPLPGFLQRLFAKPVATIQAKFNRATDAQVQEDLKLMPALLDRVDSYIDEGVIGGDQPNAADFQICSSLALWMSMDDLRPFIEDRPAGKLTRRLFPDFTGKIRGGSLPSAWFEPLRRSN
jgi:glutathione S-transferase